MSLCCTVFIFKKSIASCRKQTDLFTRQLHKSLGLPVNLLSLLTLVLYSYYLTFFSLGFGLRHKGTGYWRGKSSKHRNNELPVGNYFTSKMCRSIFDLSLGTVLVTMTTRDDDRAQRQCHCPFHQKNCSNYATRTAFTGSAIIVMAIFFWLFWREDKI